MLVPSYEALVGPSVGAIVEPSESAAAGADTTTGRHHYHHNHHHHRRQLLQANVEFGTPWPWLV